MKVENMPYPKKPNSFDEEVKRLEEIITKLNADSDIMIELFVSLLVVELLDEPDW